MNKIFVGIGLLAALSFSGCSFFDSICFWCPDGHELIPAKALGLEKVVTLDQGWSGRIRLDSWHMDQGSRILPTRMFLNLEQADSEKLFRGVTPTSPAIAMCPRSGTAGGTRRDCPSGLPPMGK